MTSISALATLATGEMALIAEDLSERSERVRKPEYAEPSELQMLITHALEGDEGAFRAIVDRYSALLFRTAFLIVGDRDIAEDAVQDTFIQAWRRLSDLREAEALQAWLVRIVVNQSIGVKRRFARTATFLQRAFSEHERELSTQAANDSNGQREMYWDILRAIEVLPIQQRVAIVLHYYHGMTIPEMARALDTSKDTLKKRLQVALARLRMRLRA